MMKPEYSLDGGDSWLPLPGEGLRTRWVGEDFNEELSEISAMVSRNSLCFGLRVNGETAGFADLWYLDLDEIYKNLTK